MISSILVACLAVAGALAGPEGRLVKPMRPLSVEMVDYINSVQSSWKAGRFDRFAKLSISSLKNLMGAKMGLPEDMPVMTYDKSSNDDIPKEFDSRTAWPDCPSLREIRDQGGCGSCWAVAAAAAMSDRMCIDHKVIANISAEDLLTCCDSCGSGCNGGYPFAAWEYFQRTGIVTGGLYGSDSGCSPYTIKPCEHHVPGPRGPCSEHPTPQCERKCRAGYDKSYKDDKRHGGTAYTLLTIEDIQRDIMTHGPAEAAFSVYSDFPTYKSGVYVHTTGTLLGGHAVKVIGWGVENGVDYWLVANSWNNDWGAHGYFKIKRGTDECGFESNIVAGNWQH